MVDKKIFGKRKLTKLEETVAEKLFLEYEKAKIIGAIGKLAQNKQNVTNKDTPVLKAKDHILLLLESANKLGASSLNFYRSEPVILLEKEGLIEIAPSPISNEAFYGLTQKGWNWLESLKR